MRRTTLRAERRLARALAVLAALSFATACRSAAVYLGSDRSARAGAGGDDGVAGTGTGEAGGSAAAGNGSTESGTPGSAGAGNTPGGTGTPGAAGSSSAPATQNGCPTGFGDCDGDASNGCETDVLTTPAHCGGCNAACPRIVETVGSTCVQGKCNPICEPLHEDCDGRMVNGCEAHLFLDPNNCGACGVVCACSGGQCL